MINENELRIAGTATDSIVDGPGLRYTLFTQGCPHHCPGCHNPKTHDMTGGKIVSTDAIFDEIKKSKGITGVTFSGGEPFIQARQLVSLAKKVKSEGLELAAYSGFTFEQLVSGNIPGARELLEQVDILVDGKFVLAQRSLELAFRGSKNQRIIDVKASLALGEAVETTNPDWLCKDKLAENPEFAPKNIREMGM